MIELKQLIYKIKNKIMMNQDYWERNSKGFEGNHLIEEQIKQLCIKHGISIIFELGTQKGATANRLSQFANVITCEINKEFYDDNLKNKKLSSKVYAFNCSSEELLKVNLKNVSHKRLLIYIDSHSWNVPSPIFNEIQLIKESGLTPVLVIHDVQNPNHPSQKFDSFPNISYTWENLKPLIESIYGNNYNHFFNGEIPEGAANVGCLFVEPIEMNVIKKSKEELIAQLNSEEPTFVERLESTSDKILQDADLSQLAETIEVPKKRGRKKKEK